MSDILEYFLRTERNAKLEKCDWTQSSDSPLSNAKQIKWATYRQELRDMMASANPVEDLTEANSIKRSSINWPKEPE